MKTSRKITTFRTFFHPVSGLAILGIDLLVFGINAPTGFTLILVVSLLCFLATFAAVFTIQTSQGKDPKGMAILKSFLAGVAAGLPFPIAGTFLGATILLLSGLPSSPKEAIEHCTHKKDTGPST